MEERKRPAPHEHDDSAPPLKKQATSMNGGSKSHPDAEMPWKDELERFQKDAIWRQMQEYKRERNTLEARLGEMIKRTTYHDDHIRIIDAWFQQLLDEVKLLRGDVYNDGLSSPFPSSLLFADNPKFEEHLQSRSQNISSAISHLFASPQSSSPEVADLQIRLSKLLAAEKRHIVELEKSRVEKDQLEERLENASLRYMVAEKKLERAKSAAVAKLERQAIFGGRSESGSGLGGAGEGSANVRKDSTGGVNGIAETTDSAADAESGRREAMAVAEKQKEQLEKLENENEKLTGQLTALSVKLSRLSDDDYSRTDLFKHLKSQHEDVIKRINNLEATNVQLREEAEKMQAERTASRVQLESESQTAIAEKELQLARAESDLARIRTGRDELIADLSIRKASQDQDKTASDQIKELAAAREDRIKALESETERLRIQLDQAEITGLSRPDLDQLSADELRSKYQALEQQYSMLSNELPSMGTAWKKASALASQKVAEFAALEEKVARLGAEKSKADQKYFAAMKAKEARDQEVRTLRAQNSKSSDIVSQLKDAESGTRSLLVNLEKQMMEIKEALNSITIQHRTAQQQITENNITVEGLKAQAGELKKSLTAKDASLSTTANSQRKAEVEVEELKVRLEETKNSLESWKSKGLGNQTGEYEMLRVSHCLGLGRFEVNAKELVADTCAVHRLQEKL
ncbi:MAG: E3 ubiquitin-protein ligase bre1 [Pleopsidium flavum]|nr:MAG: E3 ubiquitin-protein ligase bre1 [Pleopsidium flavum]